MIKLWTKIISQFKTKNDELPIRSVRYSDSGRYSYLQFKDSNGEWKNIPQVTIQRNINQK